MTMYDSWRQSNRLPVECELDALPFSCGPITEWTNHAISRKEAKLMSWNYFISCDIWYSQGSEDGDIVLLLGYDSVQTRWRSPWWRKRHAPLKRRSTSTRLHDAVFQKVVIFIHVVVRTWNLTYCRLQGWSPALRWFQYVSPKRWHLPTNLRGDTTQNNIVISYHLNTAYNIWSKIFFLKILIIILSSVTHLRRLYLNYRPNKLLVIYDMSSQTTEGIWK
jgi:hypothetical protein